jgi:two-component system response regulator LytT
MKHSIRTLIVDDERYSRVELKHLLNEYEYIDIVGEVDSGETAVMKALQLQPDVVFLDIEMPKTNGLQVATSLKELKKVPLLVFATAYPNFAVDAFRHEAVDYLVKPFDEDQLKDTITRLEKLLFTKTTPERNPSPSKLSIEGNEEIIYIDPKDILYVYRDERVTRVVLNETEYETKTALKDFEARLKNFSFFRIHKSYLVNLEHVVRLIPWFNGAYQLEIRGKKEHLSVSRNYVKKLRSHLEL